MTGGDLFDLDAAALARAEAALSALSAEYHRWVRADMETLTATLATLRRAGPDERNAAIERLHGLAHNIKGQGATFGYPLLTDLGQALCATLRALPPRAEDAVLARLDALAAAMDEIVAERLTGDGGSRGRDLLIRLEVHPPVLSPEG